MTIRGFCTRHVNPFSLFPSSHKHIYKYGDKERAKQHEENIFKIHNNTMSFTNIFANRNTRILHREKYFLDEEEKSELCSEKSELCIKSVEQRGT